MGFFNRYSIPHVNYCDDDGYLYESVRKNTQAVESLKGTTADLRSDVDANKSNLQKEEAAREKSDADLQRQINENAAKSEGDKDELSGEIQGLSDRFTSELETERQAREKGDNDLDGKIQKEVADRTAGDQHLQDEIDALNTNLNVVDGKYSDTLKQAQLVFFKQKTAYEIMEQVQNSEVPRLEQLIASEENNRKIADEELRTEFQNAFDDYTDKTDGKIAGIEATAQAAKNTADEAKTQADSARQESTAAVNTATDAQEKAREALEITATYEESIAQANATAREALDTANDAKSISERAESKADSAVSTADTANATAIAADKKADQATETANDADEKSDQAVTTANAANATAGQANTTAAAADEKADSAVTTAGQANTTAAAADKKADSAVTTAGQANATAQQALNALPNYWQISASQAKNRSLYADTGNIETGPLNSGIVDTPCLVTYNSYRGNATDTEHPYDVYSAHYINTIDRISIVRRTATELQSVEDYLTFRIDTYLDNSKFKGKDVSVTIIAYSENTDTRHLFIIGTYLPKIDPSTTVLRNNLIGIVDTTIALGTLHYFDSDGAITFEIYSNSPAYKGIRVSATVIISLV